MMTMSSSIRVNPDSETSSPHCAVEFRDNAQTRAYTAFLCRSRRKVRPLVVGEGVSAMSSPYPARCHSRERINGIAFPGNEPVAYDR